jgi:hypothetical protein
LNIWNMPPVNYSIVSQLFKSIIFSFFFHCKHVNIFEMKMVCLV